MWKDRHELYLRSFKTRSTGLAARSCETLFDTLMPDGSKPRYDTTIGCFACGFATTESALTGKCWRRALAPDIGAYRECANARNSLGRDWISGPKPGRARKSN